MVGPLYRIFRVERANHWLAGRGWRTTGHSGFTGHVTRAGRRRDLGMSVALCTFFGHTSFGARCHTHDIPAGRPAGPAGRSCDARGRRAGGSQGGARVLRSAPATRAGAESLGRGGRAGGAWVVSLGASLWRDGQDGAGPAGARACRGSGPAGARGPGRRGGAAGIWPAGTGAGFWGRAGIIGDSGKLSLYDSSHLTAVVPAGKLEPELLNFTHIQYQARDCSWHVR
jgi:hypothetical protein